MEQIERIEYMERLLDMASMAVKRLAEKDAPAELSMARRCSIENALRELEAYYGSKEWKQDFADDEAGLLPQDLKRGVLSEDGIWNLLEEWKEIINKTADNEIHQQEN